MRTLFARILVWFWATLVISIVISALIAAIHEDEFERSSPFARVLAFQADEARHAYETGGRAALGDFMNRFQQVYRRPAYLTDTNGRDLLTGNDESALLKRARQSPGLPFLGRRNVAVMQETGPYRFVQVLRDRRVFAWFLQPEHWWQMLVIVLLCYWLAFQMTSPLRKLQRALEAFGHGDLSARAPAGRRDEFGDLARTFNRMADRIQTLLAAERRLLLDISHELRSPLARLGVAVELARSGDDREAALNRIQKESERLNTLVGQLLAVTRAEGDPSTLHAEPVRLDSLVAELVEDGAVEARARGCDVHLEAPAEPLVVQGDSELLRRAIENVLRNAIRYAPQGTAVEISAALRNGSARVRVRDYGPGVPEEALPRLFDPFYRVETHRDRLSGGAGLGLAIARRAVVLHKGRITAQNAQPGLAVEIELPA